MRKKHQNLGKALRFGRPCCPQTPRVAFAHITSTSGSSTQLCECEWQSEEVGTDAQSEDCDEHDVEASEEAERESGFLWKGFLGPSPLGSWITHVQHSLELPIFPLHFCSCAMDWPCVQAAANSTPMRKNPKRDKTGVA